MAFVKLDTAIVTSTLWADLPCREVFITALLLAQPREIETPIPQISVRNLELTGFVVPPGWYGFVPAAGSGIIRLAMVEAEAGMVALEKLGKPDIESRSAEFEGRRMVRVEGGFLILNYMKYRDRDHTARERQQKLRDRRKQQHHGVTSRDTAVTSRIADADADADKVKDKNLTLARPTLEAVQEYCKTRQNSVDPQAWFDHYTSNGWKVGRVPMKDWRAAVRTWERNSEGRSTYGKSKPTNALRGGHTEESRSRFAKDADVIIP